MGGEATPPTAAARVLIADDHPLAREGLRSMLASEPDLEVVGEAEDGADALKLCRELCPGLLLMDVRMPGMDGLEATRKIKERFPKTAVLIVTSHESDEYLLEAVRAGAAGYVLKEATKGQLLGAVRRVLGGESPLDQELAMRLLRRLGERPPPGREAPRTSTSPLSRSPEKERPAPSPLEALTPREVEVLRLVSGGRSNAQIAGELLISTSTAKNHVQRILAKLGASDRTQAAVMAVELGLTPSSGP